MIRFFCSGLRETSVWTDRPNNLMVVFVALLSIATTSAKAQQSGQVPIGLEAQAGAQRGVVDDIESDLINRSFNREGKAFGQQQGSSADGAAFAFFPTGRLRYTDHEAFKDKRGNHGPVSSFEVYEASGYASAFTDVHGLMGAGSNTRIGMFAGGVDMHVRLGKRDGRPADPSKTGELDTSGFLFGGYAAQSFGRSYVALTALGILAETDVNDTRRSTRSSYDSWGVTVKGTAGRTFELGRFDGKNDVFLDLQASLLYARSEADRFAVFERSGAITQFLKPTLTELQGTLSASVFTVVPYESGAFTRTFAKLSMGHALMYENEIENEGFRPDTRPETLFEFDKARTSVGMQLGFDHTDGAWKYSAASYGKVTGDETTLGGRLGASYSF